MDVSVKVEGLAELEARLSEFDALAGEKLVRRVLRKVARPLLQRAQQNAVAVGRSGALARSVALVSRKARGPVVADVAVTSRSRDRVAMYMRAGAYGRKPVGIFYGWMLDQGHKVGTRSTGYLRNSSRSSGAAGVGKVAPRPWWTPAVHASEAAMGPAMVSELARAVARLERRSGRTANPDAVVPE